MLTIEMLWTQAHLFSQQLWQRLNQLGRKILAAMIACLLPFALFLGISSPGRSKAPITINALANLLQVPLPPAPYRNPSTDLQSDRRGLMSENREDVDRFSTFFSPVDPLRSNSVLFKTIVPHSLLPTFDAGTDNGTSAWISNWIGNWTDTQTDSMKAQTAYSWPVKDKLPNDIILNPFPSFNSLPLLTNGTVYSGNPATN